MKSIILAAGKGERLRPYTMEKPKCLVDIADKNLLDVQIKTLNSLNIKNIVIVGGYLNHLLDNKSDKLIINSEYENTNMVWSLFCAQDELFGDIILSYGDIVYSKKILKDLISSDSDISVVIDLNWKSYWSSRIINPLDDLETLKLDSSGYIIELGKKANSYEDIDGQYIGLMKFTSKGIEILKKTLEELYRSGEIKDKSFKNAYMTDLIQHLIDSGYKVKAVPTKYDWIEIDTPEDLKAKETIRRFKNITEEI